MTFNTPKAFTVGFRNKPPGIEAVKRAFAKATPDVIELSVEPTNGPRLARVTISPKSGNAVEVSDAIEYIQLTLKRGLHHLNVGNPLVSAHA